jgi:ABC-type glycerol-3-phosphate transport system permease component
MVLILLVFFMVIPFVWMFGSAFRPVKEIFAYTNPLSWNTIIPKEFTLINFQNLLFTANSPWFRYILNSTFMSISIVAIGGFINASAAYAFARLKFPGRDLIFILILATFIIPFEAIALPLYLVVKQFGWIDSYMALIIPALANAFNIFLLRQFFMGIPIELEEAAIVDGANRLSIFFRIIIPLSWPIIITTALLSFQASWDAFIWPLIATSSPEFRVIQIGISTLVGQDVANWDYIFAAVALAAAVPIIIFAIFQRYYQQGIATTGLKG